MNEYKNKLLVVDDDPGIRKVLNKLLTKEGYKAFDAGNETDSLKILQDEDIDLILLDLFLEESSGRDILKKVRSDFSDIDVIVMSGKARIYDAVELIKAGAYDFVEKPFKISILLNKISNALMNRELNLKFQYLDEKYNNTEQVSR